MFWRNIGMGHNCSTSFCQKEDSGLSLLSRDIYYDVMLLVTIAAVHRPGCQRLLSEAEVKTWGRLGSLFCVLFLSN